MTTLFGPILAAALFAQIQGATLEGKVVDEAGKPVVGAEVVFYAPPSWEGNVEPVVVQTTTGADGRYRLTTPPLGRGVNNGLYVWVYQPGSALTAAPSYQLPPAIVLRKPAPKTVRVEGPDGRPVAGACVSVRALYVTNGGLANAPESLAAALAIATGPDGNADLKYLAGPDQLMAVRVTARPIGTQDFLLIEAPWQRRPRRDDHHPAQAHEQVGWPG